MDIRAIQEQMRSSFRVEALDLLQELDRSMLELESNPKDSDLLNRLFRVIHTIKGSGSTAGFREMAAFTHHVEELFEEARQGRLVINSEMIDLALKARDLIEAFLRDESAGALSKDCEDVVKALSKYLPQSAGQVGRGVHGGAEASGTNKRVFQIRFVPNPQVFFSGMDPVSLLEELSGLGEISVVALTEGIPTFEELNPETCYLGWSVRLESTCGLERVKEVFVFVEDESELKIEEVEAEFTGERLAVQVYLKSVRQAVQSMRVCLQGMEPDKFRPKALKQLLRNLRFLAQASSYQSYSEPLARVQEQITKVKGELSKKLPLAESWLEAFDVFLCGFSVDADRLASSEDTAQEKSKQGAMDEVSAEVPLTVAVAKESAREGPKENASIRVEQEKLDRLMRAVGELLVARNAFPIISKKLSLEHGLNSLGKELKDAGDVISHISDDLQAAVMSIRMMPVRGVFQRFPRMVRDLSRSIGKEVELRLEGEGTELDKTVIEKIGDPLVHLVRNAVDHGLETPEEREASGKPRVGVVGLRAYNQGGSVIIQISDDGRGMDPSTLRLKAQEKGLLSQAQADEMDHAAALEIVFMAGFSTAAAVTDISGRGVGMDVVRNNIRQLHGSVSISSEVGKGSTFTIKLPTSLMVSQGVLVDAGGEEYLFPINCIEEMVKVPGERVHHFNGSDFVQIRNRVYPVLHLARHLEKKGQNQEWTWEGEIPIALVKVEDQQVAVAVGRFIGEEEVIIKPLGDEFLGIREFQGATIMGDGRVVLVVNPDGLLAG